MEKKIVDNKKELITNLRNGLFNQVNIDEFIKNYRFEYIYALIEGFKINLDLNLMNVLVCKLNSLYNNPNADRWYEAEDLISLYIYLGLYSEMAIMEDCYAIINLWNSRLTEIYKDMLVKIKDIGLVNKENNFAILELYSSLRINLEEEKRQVRVLTSNKVR